MTENQYDVVIVGAGITGAMVAKTLADGGARKGIKRVLILEAGHGPGTTPEGYRQYVKDYFTAVAKVPNSPYPDNPEAPSANVLELKPIPKTPPLSSGYLVQYGPMPFLSDYERAKGGTTLHWLGTCLRMLPTDFHLKKTYGQGENWPISYEDLRPHYERAEFEIGVAGSVAEQYYPAASGRLIPHQDYFGAGYQYPMQKIPQSYLDQYFAEHVKGLRVPMDGQDEEVEVVVESTPQGRNSTPNPDYDGGKGFTPVGMVGEPETGMRCEGNSACTPICPVQAKYNALKTLNAIPANGEVQVEIRTESVASKVLIDPQSGKVSGIEYKRYDAAGSVKQETVKAKIYVIAAHAIEAAKLLLASKSESSPEGVANSSGQVGRNLMDHLCLLTWGLMPKNIGAYRGPGSTSGIPVFRDGDFRRYHAPFRVEIGNWGWVWPAFSPGSDVDRLVGQNVFGKKLLNQLAADLPRQFRIAWEVEQSPDPENRVTVDPKYVDKLGNYRPVIRYNLSDYVKAGVAAASKINDLVFEQLNVESFTKYRDSEPGFFPYPDAPDGGYTVNGAGHVVGTHRMGDDPATSVVDANQRCWDHDNLYLVGCGNMPTLGTSNPTLTAAALALWAGENILNDPGLK